MKFNKKLRNLVAALEDCGIDATMYDNGEYGIGVAFSLWNCINGEMESCCVYHADWEEEEFVNYVEPSTDRKAMELLFEKM